MGQYYIAGQAALWLQPDGPNTQPVYLGCHTLEDIEDAGDAGELTLMFCPDPADVGKYMVTDSYVTPSTSPVSTSLSTRLGKVMDAIEGAQCRGNLFLHKFDCGRRDLFGNYQRSFGMAKYVKGPTTYSALSSMDPDSEDMSMISADIQAERLDVIAPVTGGSETIASIANITDVTKLYDARCPGPCGAGLVDGEWLAASTEGAVAASPQVWLKQYNAWAQTAADPLAVDDDISKIMVVPMDSDTVRIIVLNGTTDAAAPAQIAYSDDLGATWTEVTVGALNAQFLTTGFAIDKYNIWVGCDDGFVFFSADAGLTWTEQTAGGLIAQPFRDAQFLSTDVGMLVGDTNAMISTIDGGSSWALVTGAAGKAADDILAFEMINANRWFLCYDDGELYYTEDAGDTWAQRRFPTDNVGEPRDIEFINEMVGFLIHNTAAPVGRVLRTIDGGYTWDEITIPADAGLNTIVAFNENRLTVAGNVSGVNAAVTAISA